ncbi:MAG: response regulator [Sulfurimonas sp.]|uniref:HD domain-containing phosphohydrolase n=1 Tax=Sulfurimonas sp. TaxID=2022749 RepID=UPI0026178B09|nr:HD domain-containing phosphohydrolase [Sulfurimonas sp.]MDD5373084.1 response regulator [Sulfurimonas sp.]
MICVKELKDLCSKLSVLYVEDDGGLRDMVTDYLKKLFLNVKAAENGEIGLCEFKKSSFDLVITDIQMPCMNGIEMIEAIKNDSPEQEIIILTAFSESSYFMDAIRLDVSGYIIKPIDFDKINTTLFRVTNKIIAMKENRLYKQELERLVQEEVKKNKILEDEKIYNYEQTLIALVKMIERRDTYTGGHSERVAKYCKAIAMEMGCTLEECDLIYRAGILHDIGKIVTPDTILLKPGKLEGNEYGLIQEHVTAGKQMLEKIPMYKELASIIGSHHERYDGGGYPERLKGDEIGFLSRIMIIADAFDAMTTNRIYKPRLSQAEALAEIVANSAKQFDPIVAKFAVEALKKIEVDTNSTQMPHGKIEEERFSYFYKDQITGLYNQTYLDLVLVQNSNSKIYKIINFISIHNFSHFNQSNGWQEGDILLNSIGAYLLQKFGDYLIFRFEGDDFIIISDKQVGIDISNIEELLLKAHPILNISFDTFNIEAKEIFTLSKFQKVLKHRNKGLCK